MSDNPNPPHRNMQNPHEDARQMEENDRQGRQMSREEARLAAETEHLRLEKRKFLLAYVLARAAADHGNMDGESVAEEGAEAWNAIDRFTTPPK